jgi:hypothetical protein
MLNLRQRGSEETGHGFKRFEPMQFELEVQEFFERERLELDAKQVATLTRVKALGANLNPPFDIEVVEKPFIHKLRNAYFAAVCAQLRAMAAPAVVFVDPDNGFASKKADERHVYEHELRDLFLAAPIGSILLVYKHRHRHTETAEQCQDIGCERVRSALQGLRFAPPSCFYSNDAALVGTRKLPAPGPSLIVRKRPTATKT